jgi:hypothetical protein
MTHPANGASGICTAQLLPKEAVQTRHTLVKSSLQYQSELCNFIVLALIAFGSLQQILRRRTRYDLGVQAWIGDKLTSRTSRNSSPFPTQASDDRPPFSSQGTPTSLAECTLQHLWNNLATVRSKDSDTTRVAVWTRGLGWRGRNESGSRRNEIVKLSGRGNDENKRPKGSDQNERGRAGNARRPNSRGGFKTDEQRRLGARTRRNG